MQQRVQSKRLRGEPGIDVLGALLQSSTHLSTPARAESRINLSASWVGYAPHEGWHSLDESHGQGDITPGREDSEQTQKPKVPLRSLSANCRDLEGTQMLAYAGQSLVELLQHAQACLTKASQLSELRGSILCRTSLKASALWESDPRLSSLELPLPQR